MNDEWICRMRRTVGRTIVHTVVTQIFAHKFRPSSSFVKALAHSCDQPYCNKVNSSHTVTGSNLPTGSDTMNYPLFGIASRNFIGLDRSEQRCASISKHLKIFGLLSWMKIFAAKRRSYNNYFEPPCLQFASFKRN